jgi:GTPase SAR1 family protein
MTLKNIHKWVLELRKRVGKECILYLLGNKSDLIDDRNVTESDVNQVI